MAKRPATDAEVQAYVTRCREAAAAYLAGFTRFLAETEAFWQACCPALEGKVVPPLPAELIDRARQATARALQLALRLADTLSDRDPNAVDPQPVSRARHDWGNYMCVSQGGLEVLGEALEESGAHDPARFAFRCARWMRTLRRVDAEQEAPVWPELPLN